MAKETLQAELLPVKDLMRLLKLAAAGPLPCVVAATPSKDDAVLLLDKRLKGKKLAERLRKEQAGKIEPKGVRFGVASVSSDGQTVVLSLNKAPVAGTPLLITKVIKKAGYSGVTFEEDVSIEEEGDGPEADAPAPTGSAPAGVAQPAAAASPAAATPPAPPAPPQERAVVQPAATGLALGELEALARRIKPAIEANPALGRPLADAWRALQAVVADGGDARARASALQALLDQTAGGSPTAAAAPDRSEEVVSRADEIWQKSSDRLRQTLDRFKASLLDAYKDQPVVQSAIRYRLGSVDSAFTWMDDRLSQKLASVKVTADPAQRRLLARESVAIASEYVETAKNNPLLSELDRNPFGVDTKFVDTIDKVLPAVTKLMQAVS